MFTMRLSMLLSVGACVGCVGDESGTSEGANGIVTGATASNTNAPAGGAATNPGPTSPDPIATPGGGALPMGGAPAGGADTPGVELNPSVPCSGCGSGGGALGTPGVELNPSVPNPGDVPTNGGAAGAMGGDGAGTSTAGSPSSGGGGSPSGGTGAAAAAGGDGGTPGAAGGPDAIDTGAADNFSFFVTSWHHIRELSGSEDGFGGDLRYNGASTGLEGADAICQEIARRVGFGRRTWRAFLSTSNVDAIDRIGDGPWYDWAGSLVAQDPSGLTSDDRPAGGCCDSGTYDELGTFHDGNTDVNNDGIDDDDHDTMTATNADGTYAGFSCDDWTSTTAEPPEELIAEFGGPGGPFGGLRSGIMMGHSWPAQSGQGFVQAHAGHACAAGTNFIQDGPGDSATVGGGGGYGGFYCFALPE